MDTFLNLLGISFAVVVLLYMAFPQTLTPEGKRRKKTVGSTYWGVYEGQPTEDLESEKKIELAVPTAKERVIAGSATYGKGRGVSMRG
jgi:hypothetical protein